MVTIKQLDKKKENILQKHQRILTSFVGEPITRVNTDHIEAAFSEFQKDVINLSLTSYLKPNVDYNTTQWKIHDLLMEIYRTYSKVKEQCAVKLDPDYYQYGVHAAEKHLERLLAEV